MRLTAEARNFADGCEVEVRTVQHPLGKLNASIDKVAMKGHANERSELPREGCTAEAHTFGNRVETQLATKPLLNVKQEITNGNAA